ncbi:MAG: amidohydrolase family protein [Pirellula sp.]|jgi:imidazolonepropionase-like amidohydrolase|nr:amidohydrolase family protein [Pirellula sp.]
MMQLTKLTFLILLIACVFVPLLHGADTIAIRAGKVITLGGAPIDNGIIIIRDGKIEAVGTDLAIPVEAHVIDAQKQVVMPGYVDAHSSDGMGQANERNENVPFLSVVDGIDPSLDYFEESLRNGVTTVAIVPGNNTLIGGKAAIVKTAGQYVNDMLVQRDAGMKISLRPTSGSRMGHMAKLRRELDKAKAALEKRNAGEKPKSEPEKQDPPASEGEKKEDEKEDAPQTEGPPQGNAVDAAKMAQGLESMMAVVEGKMPVYLYCDTAMDVAAALKLEKDYGLNAIYVLGGDTYKAASLLAGKSRPVVLDRNLIFWETDPRTREDRKIILPEVFRKAGVPFVFQTGDGSQRTNDASSYLWYQAAIAIRHGVAEEEAMRLLSLVPAKLLKIDDVVGSIEPGKDADLVILTGEPFRMSTWVDKTLIKGKVVYDRSKDTKLERLLSPAAELKQ